MAPKTQFFPLLILSLFVLFLYSYYHSNLNTQSSLLNNPDLINVQNPNPNFTLTIKLLAYDRINSLSRCLRSLAKADYGNDEVNLHIYIDHFPVSDSAKDDFVALDKKLEDSRKILDFVDGFVWNYGEKMVHYRTGNVGLQAQWLEAWWPSSDDEFAFVVEDDLEVSPLYYKFLRGLIVNYYYNVTNYSPYIYGASLQRPRFVPGKHGNKIKLESGQRLFLYQLVGTWGQLLFPKPWKEFRLWYDVHKSKGLKPVLQGMVTTGWYKKMGERIWTPWFIKFIHSRGYFNVYTNFLNERALSVSHRDAGVNYGRTAGPDSTLLDESSLDFSLLEKKSLSSLKWYDFCFKEVLPERIVRRINELEPVLRSVQKQETVVFVSLYRVSESVIRNLICHFEMLDLTNYVFIGKSSFFLNDLARRGHPVIDSDLLFDDIKSSNLKGFQNAEVEHFKEIVVKAYVVKRCLGSKYSSLLIDGNIVVNSSDFYTNFLDSTHDFYAGKMSELFYVQQSSSSQKIWTENYIHEAATMGDSMTSPGLLSKGHSIFVDIMTKLLEQKGILMNRVDEANIGLEISRRDFSVNSQLHATKMFFWSSDVTEELVHKKLEELGLWVIDGDSSCTAVVCHQS